MESHTCKDQTDYNHVDAKSGPTPGPSSNRPVCIHDNQTMHSQLQMEARSLCSNNGCLLARLVKQKRVHQPPLVSNRHNPRAQRQQILLILLPLVWKTQPWHRLHLHVLLWMLMDTHNQQFREPRSRRGVRFSLQQPSDYIVCVCVHLRLIHIFKKKYFRNASPMRNQIQWSHAYMYVRTHIEPTFMDSGHNKMFRGKRL